MSFISTIPSKIINVIKNPILLLIILILISSSILVFKNVFKKKYDICNETENDYINNKCLPKCLTGQMRCDDICYEPDKYKCIDNKYTCMICNPGDKECCKNETCSDDPTNPNKKICCSELQKCSVQDSSGKMKTVCCGGGSICQNNKCVVLCGKKTDGSDNICDDTTEVCSIISNVDAVKNSSLYDSLKNSGTNFGSENPNKTWDFYNCRNKDPLNPTDNKPFSAPSSINNQYPCFNIPKTDQETGLGFCSKNNITVDTNTVDPDILKCKNNINEKICEEDASCKWYDTLKYNKHNIQDLNLATTKTFDIGSGLYCGENGQRIIGYTFNNANTNESMNSCFNTFINEATSDIKYDPSTGSCVSLLKCNNPEKSEINLYKLNTDGTNVIKDKVVNNINNFSNITDDIYMPKCANVNIINKICDPAINNSFTYNNPLHCLEDGTLKYSIANCIQENTLGITQKGECLCKPTYIGQICAYSDRTTCSGNGTVDYNGKCTCKQKAVNDPATGCRLLTSQEYYNDGWVKNYVNSIINTQIGHSSKGTGVRYSPISDIMGWETFIVILINNKEWDFSYWNYGGKNEGNLKNGAYCEPQNQAKPLSNAEAERYFLTPRQQGYGRGLSFQLKSKKSGGPTYNCIFNINDADSKNGIWYQLGTDQGFGRTDGIPSTLPPNKYYKLYQPGFFDIIKSPTIFLISDTKFADGSN